MTDPEGYGIGAIRYTAFLYDPTRTDVLASIQEILSNNDFAVFDTREQATEAAAEGLQLVDNPADYSLVVIELERVRRPNSPSLN